MAHEHAFLEELAKNWQWVAGVLSTIIGAFAMIRYRIKQHYQNPLMRKNDMAECKNELCVGIKANKQAIADMGDHVEECFKKHNESDRLRTENILMAVAGMQNGRNGS